MLNLPGARAGRLSKARLEWVGGCVRVNCQSDKMSFFNVIITTACGVHIRFTSKPKKVTPTTRFSMHPRTESRCKNMASTRSLTLQNQPPYLTRHPSKRHPRSSSPSLLGSCEGVEDEHCDGSTSYMCQASPLLTLNVGSESQS